MGWSPVMGLDGSLIETTRSPRPSPGGFRDPPGTLTLSFRSLFGYRRGGRGEGGSGGGRGAVPEGRTWPRSQSDTVRRAGTSRGARPRSWCRSQSAGAAGLTPAAARPEPPRLAPGDGDAGCTVTPACGGRRPRGGQAAPTAPRMHPGQAWDSRFSRGDAEGLRLDLAPALAGQTGQAQAWGEGAARAAAGYEGGPRVGETVGGGSPRSPPP